MRLFVALPNYDGNNNAGLTLSILDEMPKYPARIKPLTSSFLTHCFNQLWCEAINDDFDYFLMVHADIYPASPNWVQALLDEMALYQADAVAAISPIKDGLGLTSTALTQEGNTNQRRLTMKELHHLLPETFDAHDAVHALNLPHDSMLLLNTGLLLVDLKRHRAEIEQLYFRVRNVVERDDSGKLKPFAWSEDWYWSRDAARLGLKLMATRKVKVLHKGGAEYCNCCDWGSLEHDNQGEFIPEREAKTPEGQFLSTAASE